MKGSRTTTSKLVRTAEMVDRARPTGEILSATHWTKAWAKEIVIMTTVTTVAIVVFLVVISRYPIS